jgi:rhamnosyltransferase
VVILTRNGMPLVRQCLREVFAQDTPWPFEVIVIDTESTDGTWEMLESFPVERSQIRAQDFNHGETRNRGAAQAKGAFVVFLVQDAVPADRHWLQRLIAAADRPGVAGSYSRQLAWQSDNALVRLDAEYASTPSEHQVIQQLGSDECWDDLPPARKLLLATFRDNASCIKRDMWSRFPYLPIPYGEDLDWGERVIRAGYAIVYEPQSRVFHSHDRSSVYELKRSYADHELVMRLFRYRVYPRLSGTLACWVKTSWAAICAVRTDQQPLSVQARLALRAPVLVGARLIGSYLGAQAAVRPRPSFFWQQLDRLIRRGV